MDEKRNGISMSIPPLPFSCIKHYLRVRLRGD